MPQKSKVLVLWDRDAQRPRGMTHDPRCTWAVSVSSKYRNPGPVQWEYLDVDRIPPKTRRCSHCGGGR